MSDIITQIELQKISLTREVLLKFRKLSHKTSRKNSKTKPDDNLKSTEKFKDKLWRIWIDTKLENQLENELRQNAIISLKQNLDKIILALRSDLDVDLQVKIINFLVQNKLAKINGYVCIQDQPIYYTTKSGEQVKIGNLELTEVEIQKQKVYFLGLKSPIKLRDLTIKDIETLPKLPPDEAANILNSIQFY